MSATNPKVRTAKDELSFRRLALIGLSAVVIGGLAVGWSTIILRRAEPPPERHFGQAGKVEPREIGVMKMTPIATDRFGLKEQAEQRKVLETWGWVDREAGVARIPIEEAMKVTVETKGAPPIAESAPPPAGATPDATAPIASPPVPAPAPEARP